MSLVYTWPLPHAFKAGDFVKITGVLPKDGKRFDINLQTETSWEDGDVIFHMSNRYGYNSIVLNTRDAGTGWRKEEHYASKGFLDGLYFEIRIVCDEQKLKISINGQHLADFNIRKSGGNVRYMTIIGDAKITSVSF